MFAFINGSSPFKLFNIGLCDGGSMEVNGA